MIIGISPREWRREKGDYWISTDPALVDVDMVFDYLANESYWARNITLEKVQRFVRHSLCFSIYSDQNKQVGFARVITDFTTFAYLADVFVLPAYQGVGLGIWLISTIMSHPELLDLRKWTLNTRDAHRLYEKFGFQLSQDQETHMTYRPTKSNL